MGETDLQYVHHLSSVVVMRLMMLHVIVVFHFTSVVHQIVVAATAADVNEKSKNAMRKSE